MRLSLPILWLAGAVLVMGQTPKDVKAAAKLGTRGIPQLNSYLDAQDRAVRVEAVKALVEIGGAAILDPLIKATRDQDAEIQIRATDGLVNFYLPGYVRTSLSSRVSRVGGQIKAKFSDTNDQVIDAYIRVRPEVIGALGAIVRSGVAMDVRANAARAIGILRGQEALPDLSEALRSKDSGLMYESIVAMEKIRDREAGPKMQFVLRDLDERVQLSAIEATGILTNREAIPELLRIFNDSRNAKARRAAMVALAMMPDERSRNIFPQYLRDKDPRVRGASAEALGRLRNPSDTAIIDEAYKAEEKSSPRLSQAFALVLDGQMALTEFSPLQYLINTLNSAALAGEASALLGEAARIPEIRKLLYGPLRGGTREERIRLARLLAQSGDGETEGLLEQMSRDADSQIADEGMKALRTLRARL